MLHRRAFLSHSTMGLGSIALQSLLSSDMQAKPGLGFGQADRPAKAKNVIWLFMRGGVSHMESFDPKPSLNRFAGKTIGETPFSNVQSPDRLKNVRVVVVNDANGQQRNKLYPLQVAFKRYGQSGLEVSDWFPHVGSCADDLAVIRSMWTTDDNHGAQVQFHSGRHMLDGRHPTIGAWITYGLGSLNENLPQFVTMGPRFFDTKDGHYLGPAYDAVPLNLDRDQPLDYAQPEHSLSSTRQRDEFRLTHRLNQLRRGAFPQDDRLEARIQSYELAFRMQRSVPTLLDLEQETSSIRNLYGLENDITRPFGRQLLAARRMVEKGVRFIQIMHGDGAAGAWDAHSGLKANHEKLAGQVDLPIAGLLKDLKQRGMLSETLVVFATEFGRTPGSQNNDGRDHHPYGFSIWMAGGGIQGGRTHGQTDEIGFHAVEHPHYVTDVHATLLHQLGLDPHRMEVSQHKRLEQDFGHVMHHILA